MTSPPTLAWDFADRIDGTLCHVERAFYPPAFAFPLHRHDYAEFFFVEQGPGRHRFADGEAEELSSGDLVFIRPEQVHALAADSRRPLIFANIAVPRPLFAELERRFGGDDWPWAPAERPRRYRILGPALQLLQEELRRLERPQACCDPLQVQSLLLAVLAAAARSRQRQEDLPEWLDALLQRVTDPEILDGGPAALAAAAGCSREHLNRSIRRHCGCTLQELVTRSRLDQAAHLLRSSASDLMAIAHASGFSNLSNFYRLFRRRFGCTPRQYRLRRNSVFV